MARVLAPFLSLSASGTVARTLCARTVAGRATMNTPRRPRDRRTPSQLAARSRLRAASAAYADLDESAKQFWAIEAIRNNFVSGRNCYLRAYLLGAIVSVYSQGAYGGGRYGKT